MEISYRPPAQQVTNINQTFESVTFSGAQWQHVPGLSAPDDGKFITDNPSSADTTWVRISQKNVAGSNSAFDRVAVGNLLKFTDTTGKSVTFSITSMTPIDGQFIIGVNAPSDTLTWGGLYIIDPNPGS